MVSASPVDDQRAEVERIADELEDLEAQADIQGERYNEFLIEGQELQVDIAKAEKRVAEKEAEVARVRGDLAKVAVDAFVNSGSAGLSPVFQDAEAYREAKQAEQYSKVALSVGAASTDDLDEVVTELTDEQNDLESKKQQAEQLAEQAAAAKEQAESQKAEYQERRQDAEAKLGQLIAEEEQRRAEAAYQKMLAEQEAAQQAEQAAQEQQQQEQQASNPGIVPVRSPQTPQQPSSPTPNPQPSPPTQPPADPDPPTPDPPSTPEPPSEPRGPSSLAGIAINAARSQLGVPYRYAAASPGVAFDCSGLTMWSWGRAGVGLPHQSAQQYAVTPHVSTSSASPGDLLFYYSPISHVGIYLGGGQLVHAPNSGDVVKISSVSWGNVVGVGRPG